MNRTVALVLAALILAACGVDGAPIRPEGDSAVNTGVSHTGGAKAGATGGS